MLYAILHGMSYSMVYFWLWCCIPGLFEQTCSDGCTWFFRQILYLQFHVAFAYAANTTVLLLIWWHDGHPSDKRPYIPKRYRRWKRLPEQFCQMLKSWTHAVNKLFTSTNVSASKRLLDLHHKLQLLVQRHRNHRRLHMRNLFALKHYNQNFARPRVKFRKAQYVFPILCLSTLVVSSASPLQSHDGIQLPASFDTDSLDFGVDNRCSACISNVKEHFVGDLQKTNKVIKGYGGTRIHNVWEGTMKIQIADDMGAVETFTIPHSYYVPDGDARLLSPQHWAKHMKASQRPPTAVAPEQTFHDKVILTWNKGQSTKTIPLDDLNVATFNLATGYSRYSLYCKEAKIDIDQDDLHPEIIAESAALIEDEEEDQEVDPDYHVTTPKATSFDLDGPQSTSQNAPVIIEDEEDRQVNNLSAEFLKYHHKFNHCSPRRMQLLARSGVIPRRLAKCQVPVCSACLYGKATRRPWRSKPSNNAEDGYVPTTPGEVVSVDQMISNVPGLVAQMAGRPVRSRYKVVTVFVDQATGYSFVHLQKSSSGEETVEGKELFERYAASMGHTIKHYHADNGIFAANLWKAHCIARHQGLTFAGVGAHHQNGVAENKIRQLQDQARTVLIHAAKRWPAAVEANLWPYAVRMANDSSNEMPSLAFRDGRTPLQSFAGSRATTNPKFWQPFACPVYVLDKSLQSPGRIFGKWKERSRVGLYLGRSPTHARSIALVLNLQTGLVSPQFHVAFDPSFQTVKRTFEGLPLEIKWQQATGFRSSRSNHQKTQRERPARRSRKSVMPTDPPVNLQFSTSNDYEIQDLTPVQEGINLQGSYDSEGAQGWFDVEEAPRWNEGASNNSDGETSENDNASDHSQATVRRSNRIRKPVERLAFAVAILCTRTAATPSKWETPNEIFSMSSLCPDNVVPDMGPQDLMAYAVSNDPDTLTYKEAMDAPDKDQFVQSMIKELESQMTMGVLKLIPKSKVPPTASILPAVWAFRRKRKQTTGEVYKWKGRLNIGGHRMREGIDYDLTYSPTASWPAIRLALSMVLLHGWHAKQVDYVLAYPQAPAARPMFMNIPKGCEIPGHHPKDWVFHVPRNIYGGKDSGRVWYLYLKSKLESIGFIRSKYDDCVFYKGNAIYVLYTDDSILVGPDQQELDNILEEIKSTGLDITSEDGIEDFLGVNIDHHSDGTIHLTQKRLIQSILDDLGLNSPNVKCHSTPMASSKLLSRHPNSPAFDQSFDYRRVIGKLLFLEKSSRPDLTYAVHQCARFSHDPKVEHGNAVKRIGRYLKGTMDQGLIMKPDMKSKLDLHVDADFAGNWDKEIAATDPATAQSRHGYVLRYCGIPLLWASQLQSIIALSTTEAEYIGMSRALQDTLPVLWILQEMHSLGYAVHATKADVHCTVFQDNSGAVEIANNPKYRPRTKHINQRYHFFRSYIGTHITVLPISTDDQVADIFTKPLPQEAFIRHRNTLQWW